MFFTFLLILIESINNGVTKNTVIRPEWLDIIRYGDMSMSMSMYLLIRKLGEQAHRNIPFLSYFYPDTKYNDDIALCSGSFFF
jgi:hypothetical protein